MVPHNPYPYELGLVQAHNPQTDDILFFLHLFFMVVVQDAEGRLTLADALVFADKEVGAESIIELSTFTGKFPWFRLELIISTLGVVLG
jgi:Cytosol aminopeptidase family, catalytic domain